MKKVKALVALWLAVALAAVMTMPTAAYYISINVYTGSKELAVGETFTIGVDGMPSEFVQYYDKNLTDTQLDTFLNGESNNAYAEVIGWRVWEHHMSGIIKSFVTEYAPDAVLTDDDCDSRYIFEPISPPRDIHRITGQPAPTDPTVEVSYPDDAAFKWYEVGDNNLATPLDDETEAALKNGVAGKTYFCEVTWENVNITVNSDEVTIEASADDGGNFNAVFLLLLLKNSIRYYDGNTRVDTYRITKGETIEPLTLEDKDGMTLEGWYIDKELTEKFDFTQPIERGLQLYAKWVAAGDSAADEPVGENETAE